MKYLYIIYKGYVPEILCEEYTGRWDKNNPLPNIIKSGTFFIRIPPPILIITIKVMRVGILKIVRVIREGVLVCFSPPLAGGGKVKINSNSDSGWRKKFKKKHCLGHKNSP